ncbi:ankyrin-1-like [Chenopodium quinoa]|uniref:ankyrin-1-like n=1 Tax=Chenopodium quinoa TaxID=63459 RepID=UPI000B78B64D|nr:ankyrin-1-like [Chenopodium quinoa]
MNRGDDSGKLFKAALNGDVSHIEEALSEEIENSNEEGVIFAKISNRQADLSGKDKDKDTPLHVVAEEGNIKILKLLIEYEKGKQESKASAGSCSSLQNKDGNTPLHVALLNRNVEVTELLAKHYPEMAGVTNHDGNTPLHLAAELSNASVFVQFLAEYENWQQMWRLQNEEGNTALHVAIINNRFKIATLLLERDHELASLTNKAKETPLHLAIIEQQIFENKFRNLAIMDSDLENAVKIGDLNFLKNAREKEIDNGEYFVGQNLFDGDNILHIAVQLKHYEFIKEITRKRLSPRSIISKLMSQSNNDGNSPLHVAAKVCDDIPFFKLLLEYDEHDGQFEMKNANGFTPFHVAILNNKLKIACCFMPSPLFSLRFMSGFPHREFFCASCRESAKLADENYGKTILHWMIDRIPTLQKGRERLKLKEIEDLVEFKDYQGNKPLDLAWKFNFKVVRVLLDKSLRSKGKVDDKDSSSTSHLQRPTLKANHILPLYSNDILDDVGTIIGNEDLTPNLRAVQAGNVQIVKVLDDLNKEGSEKVDKDGRTLWHMLVNQPSSMTRKLLEDFAKKQYVIDLLKKTDNKGKTALHLALESRLFTHARLFMQCSPFDHKELSPKQLEFIKELLEIKDGDGVTPGDQLASIPDLPRDLKEIVSEKNIKESGEK